MFIYPCKRVAYFQGPRAPKLPKGHQYLMSVIHHFSPSAPWTPACGQLSCALWDVSIVASPTGYQLHSPSSCDNQKHHQTWPNVPWGPKSPLGENHCHSKLDRLGLHRNSIIKHVLQKKQTKKTCTPHLLSPKIICSYNRPHSSVNTIPLC